MLTHLSWNLRLFLLISLFVAGQVHAQGGGAVAGGGGSGDEAGLSGIQENYHLIIKKIHRFFTMNPKLQHEFKEVSLRELIARTETVSLEITQEELVDRNGVKGRTCLNFDTQNRILCSSKKLTLIETNPAAQFVLMLHEIYGLLGVEETSPKNPSVIDGYKYSKKIAPYVTKVADYDLRLKENTKNTFKPGDVRGSEYITNLDGSLTIRKPMALYDDVWRNLSAYYEIPDGFCKKISQQLKLDLPVAIDGSVKNEGFFARYNIALDEEGRLVGPRNIPGISNPMPGKVTTIFTEVVCGKEGTPSRIDVEYIRGILQILYGP